MRGLRDSVPVEEPEETQTDSVLDCLNLTVIDLHVTRSAVHLINVVAEFKKKGHFTTFYQPPSELHH